MTAVKLARIIAVLSSVLIVACRSESPSEPACRVDRDSIENISNNAVCVVRIEELLMVIQKKGVDKLELPAGKSQAQESAQCTAHRAAWEMTGFNLEVNHFLGDDEQGLRYYQCQLDAGFNGDIKEFPVPHWSKKETSKILLIDPFDTPNKDWRDPSNLLFIRDMFNQTAK
jgi:hypothetical protein